MIEFKQNNLCENDTTLLNKIYIKSEDNFF